MAFNLRANLQFFGGKGLGLLDKFRIKLAGKKPIQFRFFGHAFEAHNARAFYETYNEIFCEGIYAFKAGNTPRIIDCGANLGVAICYFKQLYPQARITAFEADPLIATLLQKNISAAGLQDVTIIPKAVWTHEGHISFHPDGALGGRIEDKVEGAVHIPCTDLQQYLEEPVDFLKMDIEGAENTVFPRLQNLAQVRQLFLEYHAAEAQPQMLAEILSLLKKEDFEIQIHGGYASPQPFWKRESMNGFVFQLNLFAYRT